MLSASFDTVVTGTRIGGRPIEAVEPRKIARVKQLWEETEMSVAAIASTLHIKRQKVEELCANPAWKQREKVWTLAEGVEMVRRAFWEAARAHAPCPSNQVIALRYRVDPAKVTDWMRHLRLTGVVQIRTVVFTQGPQISRHRVVTFPVEGLRTREPVREEAWFVKPLCPKKVPTIYRAVNYIRSKGPTVYDPSKVTDTSLEEGKFIMVDRTRYTAPAFMRYAKARGFK